jgi:hypothetical protein
VPRRLAVLGALLTLLLPGVATADWLVAPFAGFKFGGEICPATCPGVNDLVDPEDATGLRKFTFGASGGWLTDGILGVEGDIALIPGYFDRGAQTDVTGSSAWTLTGDVILTVPKAISRDGLRPYLAGGVGFVRWTRTDPSDLFPVSTQQLAIAIAGGAFGRLTDRSSIRFELRRIAGRDDPQLGYGLSFWRATVGVAFLFQ